jgi:hypothetical protein
VEYRDAPRRCFVTATTRQWFGTREVGHVRFGARTEWALVMLGLVLLVGALLLADSVATIFRLFPLPVVGVILLFGGLELAASVNGETFSRPDRIVQYTQAHPARISCRRRLEAKAARSLSAGACIGSNSRANADSSF